MISVDQIRFLQALERIAEALESIALALSDLAASTRPAPGGRSSSGPERGPPDPAVWYVTRYPRPRGAPEEDAP
jgi:hypothetical protein